MKMKQLKIFLFLLLPFVATAQSGPPREVNLASALTPPAAAGTGLTQADKDSIAAKATRAELSLALSAKADTSAARIVRDSLEAVKTRKPDFAAMNAALSAKQNTLVNGTSVLGTINGNPFRFGDVITTPTSLPAPDTSTIRTAREFFAVGDGSTNDGPALNNLFASGAYRMVLEKNKVYYSTVRLILPETGIVDWNGSTVYFGGTVITSGNGLIRSKYDRESLIPTATGLAISVKEGNNYFVYSGASAIPPGTMINIRGGTRWTSPNYPYLYSWYTVALRTSNDTVFMATAADTTFTGTSLIVYRTHHNLHLMNGTIDVRGTTDSYAIEFQNVVNSSISNFTVKGDLGPASGVNMGVYMTGLNSIVEGCWIYGGGNGNAESYGVQVSGVSIFVRRNFIQNFKHCIASGSSDDMSSNLVYEENTITGDWTGPDAQIDFHANVMSAVVRNNVVVGGRKTGQVVSLRGKNCWVYNNKIFIYQNGSAGTGAVNARGIDLDELAIYNINIFNNDFYGFTEATTPAASGYIIAISSGTAYPCVNLDISFNRMHNGGDISLGSTGRGLRIHRNKMTGHTMRPISITIASGNVDHALIDYNEIIQNFINTGNISHFAFRSGANAKFPRFENNEIWVTSASNTRAQIRIDSTGATVLNNTIWAEGAVSIDQQSVTDANYVQGNRRINPVTYAITEITGYGGGTYPVPTAFLIGKPLMIGSEIKVAMKSAATPTTFVWVTLASAP